MSEKFDAHLKELRDALVGLRKTTEHYGRERNIILTETERNLEAACWKITNCLTTMTDALEELATGK